MREQRLMARAKMRHGSSEALSPEGRAPAHLAHRNRCFQRALRPMRSCIAENIFDPGWR